MDLADYPEIDEEMITASDALNAELDAISRKAQEEVAALFGRYDGTDAAEFVSALEDGVVDILKGAHRASSEAAAAYYDTERKRQTGLDDGFKAQVLEFTDEDEKSIRSWVRYNARSLFESESG